MAKVKIQLADNIKRVVTVDPDATKGATLGTDLYLNGAVATPTTLAQWLGISAAPSAASAGRPLTAADDTNVTLSLSGYPGGALLSAAKIAAGWVGQLSAIRGGTGFGGYTLGDTLYADSTTTFAKLGIGSTGDFLQVSGGVPAWAALTTLFADPSATYGADMVGANGSATTGLRSDAVMKIDPGIAPTWTGQHIFSRNIAGAAKNILVNFSAGTSAYTSFNLYNDQNSGVRALEIDYSGSAYSGPLVGGAIAPTGEQGAMGTTGGYPFTLYSNNTALIVLSSAGDSVLFGGNVGIGVTPSLAARLSLFNTTGGAAGGADLGYTAGPTAYNYLYADANVFQTASASFRNQLLLTQVANTYGNSTDNPSHTFYGPVKLTAGYIVSGLPSGVVGYRAYVTDALGPVFGSTVVGSGAVIVPVFYNGSNWIVG